MLGVAVSFALTFSVIDLVNWIMGLLSGNNISRPIVESPNQIHVVLILAFIMGAIFGTGIDNCSGSSLSVGLILARC